MLGEAGVERLLKITIEATAAMGAVKKTEFEPVIVDTTVKSKAIAQPIGSWLLEMVRERVAHLGKRSDAQLKQRHKHAGKTRHLWAGSLANAKR